MSWGSEAILMEKKTVRHTSTRDVKKTSTVRHLALLRHLICKLMEWGIFSSLKGEDFNIHKGDCVCVGEAQVDAG